MSTLVQVKPAARTYGRPKPDAPAPQAEMASLPLARQCSNIPQEEDELVKAPARRGLVGPSSDEEDARSDSEPLAQVDPTQSSTSSSPDAFTAKFKARQSIAQMLAEADALSDEEDEVDVQATLAQLRAKAQPSTRAVPAPAPSSSTLTSLVTSDPAPSQSTSLTRPHSRTTSADKPRSATTGTTAHRARSSSPGLLQEIADFLPKSHVVASLNGSDEETGPVTARSKAPRRIVVDSDESDSSAPHGATSLSASLSKKERVEALARKRAPPLVFDAPVPEEKSMSAIEDSSEEERVRQKAARKGKGKVRPLGKKAEEEMNKTTAAMARGQNMRLVPRVKAVTSIGDILKKASTGELKPLSSRRPPPVALDRPIGTRARVEATPAPALNPTSSVSAIEVASSSPSKSAGKQRARSSSPAAFDDADRTPIARRTLPGAQETAAVMMALSEEDDELDLPTLDVLLQRGSEKKKADDAERKKAALLAKLAKTAASDSDSDFEIEGAPRARTILSSPAVSKTPQSLSKSARKLKLMNPKWGKHALKVSDSQLDAAGHTFGIDLAEGHRVLIGGGRKAAKSRVDKSSAVHVGMDELAANLLEKTRAQNHALRLVKQKKFRANQMQGNELGEQKEGVDMQALLAKKAAKLQADREAGVEEEDAEEEFDADYEEGDALDSDEQMLGSGEELEGDEAGSGSGSEQEDEEEEEEELQASGDKPSRRTAIVDDDDEEEEQVPAPAGRRRVRVAASDEDEEEEVTPPAPLALNPSHLSHQADQAGRIQLPDLFGGGDDDAGFSQFFAGGLSQEATEAGFKRAADDGELSPERAFLNPINIDAKERADDAEKLDQLAAFRHGAPATPREMEPPRQYINKFGHMTQTRPVNLYDDSPGGFSQSQDQDLMSQTQLMTPTANKSKKAPLGRLSSLLALGETSSASELAVPEPTELEPTEVHPRTTVGQDEDEDEDEDVEMADAMPTAAQAQTNPANAFDLLKAAQNAPAQEVNRGLKRSKNAFIDTEADLSEDELLGGLGGLSGDENEDGLDAELESLVDNDEVDRTLAAEQDVLARERHLEELNKTDAADLLRAQRIADGRERNRKKNGGVDLSDDDFDDDDYGMSKRRAERKEVQNKTIAELQNDEETQAFASNFHEGLHVPVEMGQYSFLHEPGSDDDSQQDTEDERDFEQEEQDEDMSSQPSGSLADSPVVMRKALTAREADRIAVERAQERKRKLEHQQSLLDLQMQDEAKRRAILLSDEEASDDELNIIGASSSPAPNFKLAVKRSRALVNEPSEYAEPGAAQYSLFGRHSGTQAARDMARYKSGESSTSNPSREKEESQGNGTTSGAMSSVTSFARRGAGGGATVRENKVEVGQRKAESVAPREIGRKLSRLASIRQSKRDSQ